MVVCICRNINDETVVDEIEKGLKPTCIVKKYECTVCAKCVPFIKELYNENVGNLDNESDFCKMY